MLKKELNGLHWLEFEIFQGHPLRHAVFTRQGGASQKPFDSLNFLAKVDSDHLAVKNNLLKVQQALLAPPIASCAIEHGSQIHAIADHKERLTGDGLATDKKTLSLLITHADCQAALFYDPVQHVLANVHCGWRGNVQNIYGKTISFLTMHFNCDPQNLLVGISPSLGPVHSEFIHFEQEWPAFLWRYQFQPFYFDLWQLSHDQLTQAGVLKENIEVARICTYENTQDFFSYRREKLCGRNGTLAFLLP